MKIKDKIIDFLIKYGVIIIAFLIGFLGLLSIFITAYFKTTYNSATEVTYFKFSFGIIEIILSAVFICLFLFIQRKILKKIPNKVLLVAISFILLVVFIGWIYILKLEPIDDQKRIHEMAIDLIQGKIGLHFAKPMYLFLYPYQLGIVFFTSIFYRIFGQNFLVFEYVNAIFSIANVYLIYLISKEIFKDEEINKYLLILLICFSPYLMFLNTYFYGNIVGLTFALISVLFILKYLNSKKIYNVLIAGITIEVSIILKTNYNIFLCGIAIILILEIIKNWDIKKLLIIPVFLVGFFIVSFSYNISMEKIYNIEIPKGVPMINFIYMGMSEKNDLYPGWYNGDTLEIYYRNNLDYDSSKEEAKELSGNRLSYFSKNPKDFIEYYAKKIGSTWLNPTFQTIWCSTPGARYEWYPDYAEYLNHHQKIISMVAGNLYKVEEKYFDVYQIIIFGLSSIGIFFISKECNLQKALLPIIFLGGFLFHIMWETKAIYVIQYYYLLLPFAAYGLYKLSKIVFKKFKLE